MPKPKSMPWRLIWPLPVLLVMGCGQQPLQPPVEPARIQPLPAAARVSRIPWPCSSTCSAQWASEQGSMQKRLTEPESQDLPAKPATTR